MNEEKCGWLTKENEAFKVQVAELETRSLNEVGTNKVAEIGEAVRAEVEKVAAGFFSVEVGRSNAIASGNRPKSVTQDHHEGLEVCKAIVDKVGASQNAATNQPVIGCESPLKLKPAVETKLVSKFKAGPSIYIERWRKHFAKINLKKPKIFDKILPSKTVGWGDIGAKLPQDVLDSFVSSHVLATQLSLNEKRQKAIIRNFNSVSLLSDMTFKHQSVNEIWFELIAFLQRKETFFQDADKSVIAIFLVRALRDGPVFGPCMLDTLGYLAESEYYNMHWFLLIRRSFRQTLLSLIPSVICIYIRAACTNIRGHHATLQNYQDHIPLLREIHKNRYFIIQWFLYVLYEKNLIYPVNLIQLRLLLLSTTIETRKPVFEFSTILRTLDKIEKDMKLRQMEFIVPPIDLNAMSRNIKELMQNAP
ncbi:hypothetical protein L596_009556 [Steinernema carpocapsae]|uniref:Uncharacterized protein n=1 Tax=Steinernema carpocapsae TaxID=34508 RepID=A0A4U5PFP3_STECR|nr:hypothetical protein L596_009556 [Steinernema carpocapsae]